MSKKCTPLRLDYSYITKYTTCPLHYSVRTTFGTCDYIPQHYNYVVARSYTPKYTTLTLHSILGPLNWQLRLLTTLHYTYTGAKLHYELHNVHNYTILGPLLALDMSTTLHYTLWREATLGSTLNVTLHYTSVYGLHSTGHYTTLTLHYTTFNWRFSYITLHSTTLQLQLHNYTPLRTPPLEIHMYDYTTLHYTSLRYATLHSTTLH